MVNGIKITLIMCLTIIVSCILCISYVEYTGRYAIVTTNDNALYIFDKKSSVLNKCNEKECTVIETKFPAQVLLHSPFDNSSSKLISSEKKVSEAITTAQAVRAPDNASASQQQGAQAQKPAAAAPAPAPAPTPAPAPAPAPAAGEPQAQATSNVRAQ